MDTESNPMGAPLFSRQVIFQLIWPLLLEQLLNVLIGMVDVLMVASLGEAAVSGVSLIDSLNNLVFQLIFAICAGGTVVISRYVGAKDSKMASKASAQLITITIFATTLIAAVLILGRVGILGVLFGAVEADVMHNALIYLQLTALSYPAIALYNASAAGFRASGDTKTPLKCSTFMNVLNIIGNAIGIYVLHMGVAGVALPTLLSRIIGAVLLFYLLQKNNAAFKIQGLPDFRLDKRTVGTILSIGIPNGIESSVFQFGKLMLQSLVATLGTAAIAGYAVACNLATYLYLPGNALGAAMLTMVGQCVGAGERKQSKLYAKLLIVINYALLAVICTVMIAANRQLVGMYSLVGQSASYASGLIIAHSVCMIMWPVAFLTPYYFRAIGRAAFTMWVAIIIMWFFRVGLAYVFIRFMHKDVLWIWYAMFVDWVARIVVYVVAFRRAK